MKNILITGSTDGIGKLVAIQLANDGYAVYIHGRSQAKVDATIAEIKKESGHQNIDGFVADFSDLNAIKVMASEVKQKLSNIDILINNAGVFKSPIDITQDGLDIRFVVNYLAPYLLTKELLPLLQKADDSRIINLSSAAQAPVNEAFCTGEQEVSVSEAYAQSKLALTMWSFYLAKEIDSIVIAVNPGSLLNTKMANEAYGQHWSSADKGSNILYDLSTKAAYKDASGKYYDNDNGGFGLAHHDAYDPTAITKLINLTEKLIE